MKLTADEIRLITVVILIVLVGTAMKHYRSKPSAGQATRPAASSAKAPGESRLQQR